MEVGKKVRDHLARPFVQIARGFVGKEKSRLSDQSAGEHNTLLLPTGQFSGAVMATRLKTDFPQPASSK